jgi:hypothetical protein
MRHSILVALLLTFNLVPLAHADEPVRDDIVDLRHERLPSRRVFLGWTADNRAVIHAVDCGEGDGGSQFCSTKLEIVSKAKTESLPILEPPRRSGPDADGFPWQVSTELASKAIRAERAALAKLGTLQPSAPGPLPAAAANGNGCNVDVAVGKQPQLRVRALGKECLYEGGNAVYEGADVIDRKLSPDRKLIAVTVRVIEKYTEYRTPYTTTYVIAVTP